MGLTLIFEGLKRSIGRYDDEYQRGRARQGALAPHRTARAVLDALAAGSPLSVIERGEVVVALVTEQQQVGHPLWQAMLVATFEPMLRKLRRRLGPANDEDLDQEVFVHFFEAIKALPEDERTAYAALALRRATARGAFTSVRRAQRELPATSLDDEVESPDPFAQAILEAVVEASAAEAARVLRGGGGGDELRDIVLTSFAGESTLKEYVCQRYGAASDAVRAAAYGRLVRARHRLQIRLRAEQAAPQPAS
jgi:DNA-directed RNA polymerase specialized sigma24 family protein